jgi:hypothetical protein
MSSMTFPVFEYPNSFAEGCSVTGGFVYRGCEIPGLYGYYVFADFCSGKFWGTRPTESGWETTEMANLTTNNFSSFGENSVGELFVIGYTNGVVARVTSESSPITVEGETCENAADGAITFNIPLDQMVDLTWADGSVDTARTNLAPGNYTIEMTTINDCEFIVDAEITAGLPYPAVPTVTLDMDGILTTDASGLSHQWLLNGNPIAGATNPTYEPTESGDYSVVVSNANGCEATSEEILVTVVATEEESGFEKMAILPNPFHDFFLLQLQSNQALRFEMTLTDAKGQTILKEQLNANGFFEKKYQLPNIPAGLYFIAIKNEQGEWTEQLVRQ